MSLEHRNYNPDLMQGASETISDDLTVTDTLQVGGTMSGSSTFTLAGAASLQSTLAVTGTATMSGVISAANGSTAAIFVLSATTDTPTLAPGTNVATGFLKITVAGTSRYIPFYA